jgi:hypothetical protein
VPDGFLLLNFIVFLLSERTEREHGLVLIEWLCLPGCDYGHREEDRRSHSDAKKQIQPGEKLLRRTGGFTRADSE